MALEALRGWTGQQKHAVAASYLGWTLDAFDYFVLVFVLDDVAKSFATTITMVALAPALTLAVRPLGAFLFGRLADDYGRRPVLIANILLYSLFGFATAFAPSLLMFLVVRALFGVAMGGIWGIGASLAMETIKPQARGFVSGLLQSGYPSGYLIASIAFGLLYETMGWRGMFMLGLVPGVILAAYMAMTLKESASWVRPARAPRVSRHALHLLAVAAALVAVFWILETYGRTALVYVAVPLVLIGAALSPYIRRHWKIALYAVVLMTGFNFFSHGTQDIYPTFLQKQHGFGPGTVSTIAIAYNIGAILGGILIGHLSQSFGRRRTIIVAALCAVPMIYPWVFSQTALMLAVGAFLMQVCVQGAWGVVPAHLNELSPADSRGTFPGTVYQLGNLIASVNAVLQAGLAEQSGGDYRYALGGVALCAALLIAVMMKLGPEAHNIEMGGPRTA